MVSKFGGYTPKLHDRTGRLESLIMKYYACANLHDRTGRLENFYYQVKQST